MSSVLLRCNRSKLLPFQDSVALNLKSTRNHRIQFALEEKQVFKGAVETERKLIITTGT